MKNNYLRFVLSLSVFLLLTWMISCSGRSGNNSVAGKGSSSDVIEENIIRLIKMKLPEENSEFKIGDQVQVILTSENIGQPPDSVQLFYDGKKVTVLQTGSLEYSVPSSANATTGRKALKAIAYRGGKARTTITRFMIILSDQPPVRNGYKVIHTYPHDRSAFTQGLFFDKGVLYEGTGQEAGSSLREVELETGKVLRQLNLSANLFGEGITLFNDKIYQVTWTSKVGFVYEKSTFKQINKIYYQTQGWGLTTVNDRIVMSDGTNVLYFFEPDMFTLVSQLEVYDDEKKVDQLNELEYINGEIWANIWMTDLIARIDPLSGKVIGYINLKGILNDPDTDTSVKVLNGIAFDGDGKRIFVTGKNWPKLFEIQIVK